MTTPTVSHTDPQDFPLVSRELLEFLESRYPERCWQPGDDLDALKFYAGKRDLVRLLRLQFEDQNSPSDEEA